MNNAEIIHREIRSAETRARLVATAARLLGNASDAEDCVQEALLLAARHAPSYEGRACPRSWLFSIVRNTCHMSRRAQRRMRRGGALVHVSLDDEVLPLASEASDPEGTLIARSLAHEVVDELARIPTRDAELFERCVLDDRPLRVIADETGTTHQAVKSRLFRVRRRLAERISAVAA